MTQPPPLPPPEGPAYEPPEGPAYDLPTGPPYDPPAGPPEGPAYDLPPPGAAADGEWHRQSPRMLLVHPVRVLWSMAFPIVIAFIGISQSDNEWSVRLLPVIVVAALAFGLIPWFTTLYRFTDTQLQVRTGLLNRKEKTARLDRVRSVDLESPPLHRILGLVRAKIGTGVDDTRVELDGLAVADAAQLREYLLLRGSSARSEGDPGDGTPFRPPVVGEQLPAGQLPADRPLAEPVPDEVLAEIDWSWLRYAPFSLSSLVIVATAFGLFFQFSDDLGFFSQDRVTDAYEWLLAQAIMAMVLTILLILVLGWLVVSTLNYVLQWWNLRLVREPGGTIRLTRGLLTTTSSTVEEERIRGVQLTEPLLLRAVRGGELTSLATGVGSGGTTKLLPPCPRTVAESVGHSVLGTEGPLTTPVRPHGPAARRRLLIQSLWPSLAFTAAAAGVAWWRDWPWWSVIAVFVGVGLVNLGVAELAYRNLGHQLTPGHLVSRSGALQRQRVVLERGGIIGWVVRQSFFQRRRGLADLLATTAAGPEVVAVTDIPLPWAVELASAATPQVVDQFRSAGKES